MLTVSFAFNFGLYRTFIERGREAVYIHEGYVPLVDALLAHPRLRSNLFFEALTARAIAEECPSLIGRVRAGAENGLFEIGTYTYNHPVLSLLPYEDTSRQLAEALAVDEELWGRRPVTAMLPEVGFDPSIVKALSDLGVRNLIMGAGPYRRDFPGAPPTELHSPLVVRGIFGASSNAVFGDYPTWAEGDTPYYRGGAVVQDAETNFAEFVRRCAEIRGASDGAGLINLCKNDAEFIYEDTLGRKYGRDWGDRSGFASRLGESVVAELPRSISELNHCWSRIERLDGVCFATASEFLAAHPPRREAVLRPSFREHREWLEGSEKVGALLDEARREIKMAEYALRLAAKAGMGTAGAEGVLRQAWLKLLEAEISTGRRACAHPVGKASRVVAAMEAALEAKRLAAGSIDLIETA